MDGGQVDLGAKLPKGLGSIADPQSIAVLPRVCTSSSSPLPSSDDVSAAAPRVSAESRHLCHGAENQDSRQIASPRGGCTTPTNLTEQPAGAGHDYADITLPPSFPAQSALEVNARHEGSSLRSASVIARRRFRVIRATDEARECRLCRGLALVVVVHCTRCLAMTWLGCSPIAGCETCVTADCPRCHPARATGATA